MNALGLRSGGLRWTSVEEAMLRAELGRDRGTLDRAAQVLGRSFWSCESKAIALGIPTKRAPRQRTDLVAAARAERAKARTAAKAFAARMRAGRCEP